MSPLLVDYAGTPVVVNPFKLHVNTKSDSLSDILL